MHKEIKSILCSVVRGETIDCFEKTISCFFVTATNQKFLKTGKNQNVIAPHISQLDEDLTQIKKIKTKTKKALSFCHRVPLMSHCP